MLSKNNLPRRVGIGIYGDRVIADGIGLLNRWDYTVIGDSQNVAVRLCSLAKARLCSLAKEGEIICNRVTLRTIGALDFGVSETITVKGRSEPLAVQRICAGEAPAEFYLSARSVQI